jgi:hypothetical protein
VVGCGMASARTKFLLLLGPSAMVCCIFDRNFQCRCQVCSGQLLMLFRISVVLDLWYLPSPSNIVTVELFLPISGTAVSSPLLATARLGVQNFTLNAPAGFSKDVTFNVVAQTGIPGASYTVRIIQEAQKGSDDSRWSMRVSGAGLSSPLLLNFTSAAPVTVVSVNFTQSYSLSVDNNTLSCWMSGSPTDTVATSWVSCHVVWMAQVVGRDNLT